MCVKGRNLSLLVRCARTAVPASLNARNFTSFPTRIQIGFGVAVGVAVAGELPRGDEKSEKNEAAEGRGGGGAEGLPGECEGGEGEQHSAAHRQPVAKGGERALLGCEDLQARQHGAVG